MMNSVKELLKGFEVKNAMEVLPELDLILAQVQELKDVKTNEFISFANKYGMEVTMKSEVVKPVVVKPEVVESSISKEELMEIAKQEADNMLQEAKDKADKLIEETMAQVEEDIVNIITEAEEEAELIKQAAGFDASKILEDAKKQANEIIRKAKLEAELITNNAHDEADKIKEEAKSKINISRKMVNRDIAKELEEAEDIDFDDVEVKKEETIEEPVIEEKIVVDPIVLESSTNSIELVRFEQDNRNKNCNVGLVKVNGVNKYFHCSPVIDTPMVYNAKEGDEEIVRQAIMEHAPSYFNTAKSIYRYVDYANGRGMYKNSQNIYVGYIGDTAVSWDKNFEFPCFLASKYVNRKGFKPADLPDFIEAVQDLINKYEAGLAEYEAKAKTQKAALEDANHDVFKLSAGINVPEIQNNEVDFDFEKPSGSSMLSKFKQFL